MRDRKSMTLKRSYPTSKVRNSLISTAKIFLNFSIYRKSLQPNQGTQVDYELLICLCLGINLTCTSAHFHLIKGKELRETCFPATGQHISIPTGGIMLRSRKGAEKNLTLLFRRVRRSSCIPLGITHDIFAIRHHHRANLICINPIFGK